MNTTFFSGFIALAMGVVHVVKTILRGVRWFTLHVPLVIVGFLKYVFPILALGAAWFWLAWLFWDLVLDAHAKRTGGIWVGASLTTAPFPWVLNGIYNLGQRWQHGARWTDPHSWERAQREITLKEIESKKARDSTQSHG